MAYTWFWKSTGERIYVSLTGGALTLNFAERVNVSFDGAGRLIGAWFDGVTFRRALDNRVLAKWSESPTPGHRHRRFLSTPGRKHVIERAYAYAFRVEEGLRQGTLLLKGTPPAVVRTVADWLERVRNWDWHRLEGERERFYRVYKPIPILPPDQYLALVLQMTEGCSYNRCTFCTFYRDRPFRIKGEEAFRQHILAVREFLGQGITTRRTIFLADANAVMVPQHRLLPLLRLVNELLPVGSPTVSHGEGARWDAHEGFRGIYAFLSAPDALRKTPEDFAAMRALNLRRVYVGLESGHDPLRAFILKQGSARDVLRAVETIKGGGVRVGIIFMAGIGGDRFREAHFRDTVALIQAMPLGRGDIVYVSPFVPSAEAPYVYDAAEAGIRALEPEEIRQEVRRFREALLPWARSHDVRLSHYDIREFLY